MTQVLIPAIRVGHQDGIPDSWLQPGSDVAVVATWGVHQRMEDLDTLTPCLSQRCFAFQVDK